MNLRPYQEAAINSAFEYLYKQKGNQLIVAPTGSGKSIIIAGIIKRSIKEYSECKILILSHRKEILEQNAQKIIELCPEITVGIYSAGLGIKKIKQITIAGIQSISKTTFPAPDLLIIDECHLIPKTGNGQYLQVINKIKSENEHVRIIGLTASPFRLDSGLLTEGKEKIFNDVSYDITIKELLALGHLAPLVSKSSVLQPDFSGVKKRGGDYLIEAASAVMNNEFLTNKALDEVQSYAHDRESLIFFCTNTEHVKNVTNELKKRGVKAELILGDTESTKRKNLIAQFKKKEIRALVSCEVLTTGFDAPNVDCVVLLRPTLSTGLFIQMLGRGMRPAPNKKDCLVLDYGENLLRHGPVDDINISSYKEKEAAKKKDLLGKACPKCLGFVALASMQCPSCSYEFPEKSFELKHGIFAEENSFLSTYENNLMELPVEIWSCSLYKSQSDKVSARVRVGNAFQIADEYLCFDHGEKSYNFACKKWRILGGKFPYPVSCEEAVNRFSEIKKPAFVTIRKNERFLNVEFVSLFSELERIRA